MTDTPARNQRFRMSRRRLILGGSLVGGALIVGYAATNPMQALGAILQGGGSDPEPSAFGPFIRITEDGWVTIVSRQQELGQGIHAGLAALVAEELDADWDKIRVIDSRSNFRAYGPQVTGASNGIASNWDLMRNAGAAARAMFVGAAALRWGVPSGSIDVRDGIVSHPASNRTATFAALLADASRQTPPESPVLKQPGDYRLIGTDKVRRKDSLPKSTGLQVYTQDIQRPDMLVAMVAHSPRFGGKLSRFDASDARKVKGVVDVFAIETGVAVVAETTYAAWRGRDALRIEWDDGEAEKRSTEELVDHYHDLAAERGDVEPSTFFSKGENPEIAFNGGDVAEFVFDFPYLAHAPMETLDCVAQVNGWDVAITSGAHAATIDQVLGALAARTIPGKVDIEIVPAGGSFGRRSNMSSDYLVECVLIAKRTAGRPVKLMWSREDEMMSGYFRPMSHHRAWVEIGVDGFPTRWRVHSVCQALFPIGPNNLATEGITNSPYFSTAATVDGKIFTPDFPVVVGLWRSVGHSHTALVMEHIVDQLARRAGLDPAAYRRVLYEKAGDKRRLAVLDELCLKAGWDSPIEPGWARGLAIHEAFGTIVGQVAEVRLVDGRPIVRRVVAVVDCGISIANDQIAAQMEGGIAFGLTAALYGAVTLKDGIVQETNFDRYPILRMNEMPAVETHIIKSANRPTGMGEPGVPPIAPAVANAMLALTGTPTTSLPFLSGNALGNSDISAQS
ncbi:molybdopterin-dependent oxidoreductase [Phyllobacterium sp. 0TCS1.6C]|uniref:xanthine dehydrogenase family protein molybdopterin-binding subunit n=1 Tax=unclassified Phyllobacterium TaxID=2638441 RepID=UPI002263DA1A|nr:MULTISPECIES: molybdopterin cofactor-binding domain-containing protein [unclassified Phyllobacterium]MCX8279306.1 molybdopterin-dependent oxidoreductase [Phyllobacterium sp. 0TCS1.6C]MCX8294090.1 molybdopterin-dependent oxidoreductase [Phyllobacterium sp. 0TCS1.6A]